MLIAVSQSARRENRARRSRHIHLGSQSARFFADIGRMAKGRFAHNASAVFENFCSPVNHLPVPKNQVRQHYTHRKHKSTPPNAHKSSQASANNNYAGRHPLFLISLTPMLSQIGPSSFGDVLKSGGQARCLGTSFFASRPSDVEKPADNLQTLTCSHER